MAVLIAAFDLCLGHRSRNGVDADEHECVGVAETHAVEDGFDLIERAFDVVGRKKDEFAEVDPNTFATLVVIRAFSVV